MLKSFALFVSLLLLVGPGFALGQAINNLEKVKNLPKSELETKLELTLFDRPLYQIQENLAKKVLVIKFHQTKLGDLPKLVVFKDPLIAGVEFEQVSPTELWAKFKLKHPNLLFKVVPQKDAINQLVLQFTRKIADQALQQDAEVVEMFRELNPTSERLIITLDKPIQFDIIRDNTQPGAMVKLRLLATKAAPDLIVPGSETNMIKSIQAESRGKYLLFTIAPARYVLNIDQRIIKSPEYQLILSITEDTKQDIKSLAVAQEQKKKQEAEANKEQVEREKFMARKFEEAEYQFRIGKFQEAGLLFKNIYNFSPLSDIGVRAIFRSADAYYQGESTRGETADDDFVITQYRIAINAALTADLGYDDVPRAYYNMGRILMNKKLYPDAFNIFSIITDLYPDSPFSKEAHFQKGVIHLAMQRYEKAAETLQAFIRENATSRQVPYAYYKVAEAQFQMKRFVEAKQNFDKAWSMDPAYMKTDAELMFHMGEAYFENKAYETARSIYEELLDLYPDESFSNLVAIRIGDFLRAEDKLDDAIKAYERAIVKYAKELLIIGKMRIANIYAEKPEVNQYKKALEIYDFVIIKHPFSEQVEEAMLRKGLTQAMFQEFPAAVESMEQFCKKYPDNIYVKHRIIQARILDTLRSYMNEHYDQGRYMEVLSVWEKYSKQYYIRPQGSACFVPPEKTEFDQEVESIVNRAPLFLIADSYYRLGLYEKALSLYDEILKDKADPLAPLAWYTKGLILDAQDKSEEAQQIYADWIIAYPQHSYTPTVKKAFGDAYYKVHKFDRVDKAIRIYNQTIRDYSESENPLDREIIVPCYFALGNLYQAIGKYDDAIDAYKQVIATYEHPLQDKNVAPIVVDTHYILGNMYFELNALPEALASYNEAIDLFPNSEKTPWAKYQKGQIFIKYNQKAKALAIFEGLIEEAKKQPEALWGAMAVESRKMMINDLKFDQWLGREAKPVDQQQEE